MRSRRGEDTGDARTLGPLPAVYFLQMSRRPDHDPAKDQGVRGSEDLPRPSIRFRLACWQIFQRALDPLAQPKPIRQRRP
jgi:hypothetical protein